VLTGVATVVSLDGWGSFGSPYEGRASGGIQMAGSPFVGCFSTWNKNSFVQCAVSRIFDI